VINATYPGEVLDVFTTQTLNASRFVFSYPPFNFHSTLELLRRIEYEFGQFGPSSETYYGYFNATMLNDAAGVMNNTIASNYPAAPDFLFATLLAYNASGAGIPSGSQTDVNGTGTSTSTSSDSSDNTGVAM
jgi:hypothetical protein